jgi:hypothetical protein
MEYDDEVIVEEGPESLDPIEAMAGGWDAAKTQADTECDDWCGGIGLWCPSGGYGCEGDVTMASSRDDLDELMEGRLEDGQLYGFRHLGYWDPDQGGYMDTRYYILEKTYQYNCKCKCVWSLGLFLAEMIGGAIDAIGSAGAGRAG